MSKSDGSITTINNELIKYQEIPNDQIIKLQSVNIKIFERLFKFCSPLGEGKYGKVYLYEWNHKQNKMIDNIKLLQNNDILVGPNYSQNKIAIKTMSDNNEESHKKLEHEIYMHARINEAQFNSNSIKIIPLLGIIEDQKIMASIMPVMTQGTLEDEINLIIASHNNREYKEKLLLYRWSQGDTILNWLHDQVQVIHGDAHLENWFLTPDRSGLLLGDFGESRGIEQCQSQQEFIKLCSYERLLFSFDMSQKSKMKLGEALSKMEERCPELLTSDYQTWNDNNKKALIIFDSVANS